MNLPDSYRGNDLALRQASLPGAEFGIGNHPDRLNLRAIVSIFRRRLTFFLGVVALCVMIALLMTFRTPPRYTASADVMMKSASHLATPGSAMNADDQPQRAEEIETQLQLIRSRDLAAKVFDQLKLGEDPAFVEAMRPGGAAAKLKSTLGARDTAAMDPARFREGALDRMIASLDAKRIGTAYAIRIAYTDLDPTRAARIANGYASIYSTDQIASKVTENREAIGILNSRMEELRRQAQQDFGAVQEYRIRNNLLSRSATSLTEQEISAYNQQIAIARAAASEDQARLATARTQLQSGTGGVGEAQSSPVVQSLRSQRALLSAKVAEMSARYLDTHPELAATRQQLAELDGQIAAEVTRTLFALDARARASAQRLASLQSSLGTASGTLAQNNSAMVQLDDLERRAQASQALYESYLNRYKEAVAQSGAEQSDSRLLSAARVPGRPSSPNLPLNLTLGLLVGVLLGAAGSIAVESAYAGLTTGEDVENRLGVTYLGGLPALKSIEPDATNEYDTIADRPGGPFAESLRSVLTAIRQAPNGRNQVIAITSALPGEGKTTLAACLARSIALGGERVALLDCDTVRRHLTRRLVRDLDRPGLLELLEGRATLEEASLVDPVGSLAIVPVTTPFPKGERVLERGRLHRLIAKLREEFDIVIIDCPPILPIAETRELVTLADNVVVVARWRKTSDSAVRAALKLLPMQSINDIGLVLNSIDMRKRVRFGDGDAAVFYNKYKAYYDNS